MSASLDEAQYNFTQDAPNSVATNFYILVGDNAYGYSYSATNLAVNILGDVDTYALHVNPGHSYTFIANAITPYGVSNSQPSFVINDAYNNVLAASTTFGGTASYTDTALYNTYFVKVFTANPGYYALRVEDNTIKEINGIGEAIIAGKTYNAALDYASDVDHYLFNAVAGHTYAVSITTTVYDLFLKIFNVTTNAATTAVTSGGIWTFTPDVTGSYDLAISSNSFYNTGAYSFVAADATPISNNGHIAYDIPVSTDHSLVYRLYQAALARTPDEAGFRFWIGQKDQGATFTNLATAFRTSSEFNQKYGTDVSNAQYVELLYKNVLGRSGEAAGVTWWTNELNTGHQSKDLVLIGFAGSPENVINTSAHTDNGYWFA